MVSSWGIAMIYAGLVLSAAASGILFYTISEYLENREIRLSFMFYLALLLNTIVNRQLSKRLLRENVSLIIVLFKF